MLYWKSETKNSFSGIWKVEETNNELLALLDNKSALEKDVLSLNSDTRIKERLAVRVLLRHLLTTEKTIIYLDSGKPYLEDKSFNISISHTKGYVAVELNKTQETGIDIEHISEKVQRVRTKFVSIDEFIDPENELTHLLLHWSAKESMYKLMDESGIDLKGHLHIKKFIPRKEGTFDAFETHSQINQKFLIEYRVETDFVFTRATLI